MKVSSTCMVREASRLPFQTGKPGHVPRRTVMSGLRIARMHPGDVHGMERVEAILNEPRIFQKSSDICRTLAPI